MTSRRLFFKALGEDIRHKIWMAALSVLGNFLAMPVAWLVLRNNLSREAGEPWGSTEYLMARTLIFFNQYLMAAAGCVAISGAVVVGLFGFRYLFRQRMVDTYHSLPVKRGTLFGMCYGGGFLIWFVPALCCLVLTLAMAGGFVYGLGGWPALGEAAGTAAVSFAALAAAFLLVYNMVLVAVMLSGNILNALVSMLILGFGAAAVYGLGILFFSIYMDTFYGGALVWENIMYLSPFFSSVYLLACRGMEEGGWVFWKMILADSGVAALLGMCTWFLYKRRASELAEQGIRNRLMGILLKSVTGIAAGMCGWQIFVAIVLDSTAVGWGIFGAVLAVAAVFGILDVIFRMDFRAFFAHKFQMAVTVAVTLLICFAFYWDWFGYDMYLPGKDEIAEIAVYNGRFTNNLNGMGPLANMAFGDREAIYAYLEAMTARQDPSGAGTFLWAGDYDRLRTKVTLENGRTYYRSYSISADDRDIVWPLLANREYVEYAYCIKEEWAGSCGGLILTRCGKSSRLESPGPEKAASIIRAYNEDVLEDPEVALLGKGRLFARMEMTFFPEDGWNVTVVLDIYETMVRTLDAMREAGYGEWVTAAQDVRSVTLPLTLHAPQAPEDGVTAREAAVAEARELYGVYGDGGIGDGKDGFAEGTYDAAWEDLEEAGYMDYAQHVSDREEVEELLALVSYAVPAMGDNVFREGYADISVEDGEGNVYTAYIQKGLLPEKFILRFGE